MSTIEAHDKAYSEEDESAGECSYYWSSTAIKGDLGALSDYKVGHSKTG